MPYERITVSATIPAAATSTTLTFPLKSDFVAPMGFRASCVTDTTTIIQLADADGKVFYLDAATKDYTVLKDKHLVFDDTATGLTAGTPFDLTGVVIGAGLGVGQPIIKSPVTLTWSSGTAADTLTLTLYYQTGFDRVRTVLNSGAAPANVQAQAALRTRYSRIYAFRAVNTGGDTSTRLQFSDADNRVLFLDAADVDYTTAKIKTLTPDDTLTGIGPQTLDATGAAMAATQTGSPGTAVGKSPLTITWSNSATANDVMTCDIFYEL